MARNLVEARGNVLGERYLPLGNERVEGMLDGICATRPFFVLNNHVGGSSYPFLRATAQMRQEEVGVCPMLSCNLTECEFPALGPAAEGLVSPAPMSGVAPTKARLSRPRRMLPSTRWRPGWPPSQKQGWTTS